jgi:transposase-like protein
MSIGRVVQGRRTADDVIRRHLAAQHSSGSSVAHYCREHGFSVAAFYEWRKRCGASGTQAQPRLSFVELPVPGSRPAYELTLGDGMSLRFGRDAAPSEVAALASALRASGGVQ